MKLRFLLSTCLITALALSASAQEYYDLTDTYLSNAGFDTKFDFDINATGDKTKIANSVDGWTTAEVPAAMMMLATYQFGTKATAYANAIPAQGENGTAEGGCLSMGAGLGNIIRLNHKVQLPPGKYMLITALYNIHPTAQEAASLTGWLPEEGDAVLSAVTSFRNQQWFRDTVRFEVTATTKGQLQLGFQAGSARLVDGPLVLVDYVKLLRDTPYDEAIDVTGDVPTVKTDKRFARGATMAFGRMSASIKDGKIIESGFCWSESPEPTINDFTTTEKVANASGTIYWLRDLKPATKYYMRAYAKTEGRQVGYGDVIKFYTIPQGQVKFSMRDGETTNTERIRQAAQTAVNWWNALTEMKGFTTSIGYNSGTPTAECSYGGWMSVGSNQSYQRPGTIMHEMLHGVGVIPWADTEWSRHNLRSGVNGDGYGTGQWLGDRVTEVLHFWKNNSTEVLNGDYQHMWPYGINGASEDNGSDELYIGNGLVCQALGEDGLQHTSALFAEPYYALDQEDDVKYYIKNESEDRGLYDSYLVPTATGSLRWRTMSSAQTAANDSAAWYITFTPKNQYYQFRNAATGQHLTYSGGFKTMQRSTLTNSDNFHLMRGRIDVGTGENAKRGYWIISPASNWTPAALQANANGVVGSSSFNIANKATAQRWLILSADECQQVEQAVVQKLGVELDDFLTKMEALLAVPHTEEANGTNQQFQEAISGLRGRMATASTPADMLALRAEADQDVLAFLSSVTPTDANRPFDLTYMIRNAGMDAADGWSVAPSINHSCGEFYERTFDFYQTVNNLPAGNYEVRVQGFQRPGDQAAVVSDYNAGKNLVNATFYAGDKSVKLAHIAQDAPSTLPNTMQTASNAFAKGYYENCVTVNVGNSGVSMKVGLKSTSMPTKYWVIFDNFRLLFFGTTTRAALGISEIVNSKLSNGKCYDLQGRQISNIKLQNSTLKQGIYIQNGKKVVIK